MFSILGDLEGLRFLDLFSGSGLVGLEAYSRGASRVVLVERDRRKAPVIRQNLELAEDSVELVIAPAERYVQRAPERFDVIYLDPPFPYRYKAELVGRVLGSGLVAENARVLIHAPRKEDLPENPPGGEQVDLRRYGGSMLTFYESIG
jgi:16S rRNA (guanine(966)-N(2))-methyltransferase RsmD